MDSTTTCFRVARMVRGPDGTPVAADRSATNLAILRATVNRETAAL